MINNMAREAGLPMSWLDTGKASAWPELERFAQLVAAAERERCAKVCESDLWVMRYGGHCAEAIRNQEKKE